ncbi:MAG: D-tyrosyl-tRNA(Tyr) deacylase [Fibrobacteres bacterium]|nr:D-tyrosyl-tRNA(Tyr) deacylase [Fibrobacterota bacterium]
MRIVAQRVGKAAVEVAGETIASIGRGLLLLAGISPEDTEEDAIWLAGKLVRMRIFPDVEGKMNLSVADIGGDILLVSQFTLFAGTSKGNRPTFSGAAGPDKAIPLYGFLAARLEAELGRPVSKGRFGADMKVSLDNDGPVTIVMDSKSRE